MEKAFRPLTRMERRNLWLKEYGDQDFALQMWVRLVEQQDLEIEMMLQMHGLLVFGVMVSTQRLRAVLYRPERRTPQAARTRNCGCPARILYGSCACARPA